MPQPQKPRNDSNKQQHRINEQIRVREVRIVGDDIEPMVVPTRQALDMARQQGVDLVEISPNAEPPVCRLISYSKFLYQQKKRQKELKAKQTKIEVKEIRFGPQTDEHDYNFKLKHAKEFLSDGDKVKAYVFFRGRSILFKEQGEVLLLRFANDLEEYGKVESMPKLEGKRMIIFIAPKKTGGSNRKPRCSKKSCPLSARRKPRPRLRNRKNIRVPALKAKTFDNACPVRGKGKTR